MPHTLVEPLMKKVLLDAARAYARTTRQPMRRVSHKVYGDSRFFESLARRPAISMTARKFDDAMSFFHDPRNWPGGDVAPAVVDLFDPRVREKG